MANKNREYLRIAAKIRETPWLITPEGLDLILSIVESRMAGSNLTDEEIAFRLENAGTHGSGQSNGTAANGVGVLPIYGPIFGKANLMTELSGACSMEAFRADLAAMLADPSINSIILDVDSPGGTSEMVPEAGAEIFAGRDVKPIYSIANSSSGSAAYWLASQATKMYATPSGSVGSIGVYTVHQDQSGADAQAGRRFTYVSAGPYKTEGNPHEPLSAEGIAYRQETVDELYNEFLGVVARGRGTDVQNVKDNFGGGRMFSAKKSLEAGMVDGIMEYDALVSQLTNPTPQRMQVAINGKYATAIRGDNGWYELETDETGAVKLEVAEWEHSDPGQSSPPPPKLPEHTESDITSGSRRNLPLEPTDPGAPKPKSNEDGVKMDKEKLDALMKLFKVDTEEALISAITDLHNESTELRAAVGASATQQQFKEAFPEQYAEHVELVENGRKVSAKQFVAKVATFTTPQGDKMVPSKHGLSALAMETVEKAHIAFASGSGTLADFESAMNAITQGGTVLYGEKGSGLEDPDAVFEINTDTAQGLAATRALFAEKVAEVQVKDEVDFKTAFALVSEKFPDLAQAYRVTLPA